MAEPLLQVSGLQVHYGHAHALQGVSFTLDHGVFSVVGRNGMGKTTLCNAVMGLVPARGSLRLQGREILGLAPNAIVARGVGYVPQGRRVWPSLTVEETLRLAARSGRRRAQGGRQGSRWDVARVYETFPRLAERRRNGGGQLSGGEQQMLAIGRALLANPLLLVMDEPTEGLAPVIVQQLSALLKRLAEEGEISVLLIEQNLGVATAVAERVGVMVNGRLLRELPAAELAADLALQQRLLGVGSHGEEEEEGEAAAAAEPAPEAAPLVLRVRRAGDGHAPGDEAPAPASAAPRAPTRWSRATPLAGSQAEPAEAAAETAGAAAAPAEEEPLPAALRLPVGRLLERAAYVAGTFDTKGRELLFLARRLQRLGLRTVTVDLSTSGRPSPADVGPQEVARHHPKGAHAVFVKDRGAAVAAMAEAFARWLPGRRDLGGVIAAGGSGGTALATPAMQRLAIGLPKLMVSTVASGDVKRYVGPSDICMLYSVTDVQGINRISERVLSNAAHALAGMIAHAGLEGAGETKPAVGLTMFGVTTPCVQAVTAALEAEFDCLVFHATGTGGQSMEKLAESGMLAGLLDISTTEVADLLVGGVFPASEDRFGAVIRSRLPYVGAPGALDMVNFGPRETVPARFRHRRLHQHNPQVTLMRTTAEENAAVGRWIAERLNRCEGPLRFLLPEGGVSLLDAPGGAFWDPEADRALFTALEQGFRPGPRRRLIRLPHNLNDPAFAAALVQHFREVLREGGG